LDIVVANDVSGESSGFDSDLNAVTILIRDNTATEVPLTSKLDVAHRILDEVAKMRRDGPIEME
jgi:phosphopantothenoylcysteine decarboxylase/phosphopantothenate--cysteine ligase